MKNSYLRVYRPIKTNRLNQGFGYNLPCAKLDATGKPIRPFQIITGGDTCPVGYAKFYPLIGLKGHNGEDWATWHGEPLYFPVDCPDAGGWYAKEASDQDGGLGVDVVSKNAVVIDGKKTHIKFRFWHLQKTWKDEEVQFGEMIGNCDNTGASSGDHLHWSMKLCDKDGNSMNNDNGYAGAVDFAPYFENTFVLDYIGIKAQAMTAIDLANKLVLDIKKFFKL